MNNKVLLLLIALGIGAGAFWYTQKGTQTQAPPRAPIAGVNTIKINPVSVINYSEMPGKTLAFEEAEVRPEVTGIIRQRVFQEGAYVNEGDTLYLIESELYKASYDSAKANFDRAQAAMNVARLKEQRTAVLRRQNSISQQDYDETRAVYLQANAEVAAANAAVTTAKINLDRTEIKAPISGLIGKSTVTVGTLVSSNQAAPLTTIYNINPMNVDLTQSVQELVSIRQDLESRDASIDFNSASDLDLDVLLLLPDSHVYKEIGKLGFIDVGVNEDTATMTLRASFPNPDYILMPGLFVRARVQVGIQHNAILIPQRSVLRDTRGLPYVFVAQKTDSTSDSANTDGGAVSTIKAARKNIELGASYGTNWLVKNGLNIDDEVIVKGLQSVTEGSTLSILETTGVEVPSDAPYLYREKTDSTSANSTSSDASKNTSEMSGETATEKETDLVETELKGE